MERWQLNSKINFYGPTQQQGNYGWSNELFHNSTDDTEFSKHEHDKNDWSDRCSNYLDLSFHTIYMYWNILYHTKMCNCMLTKNKNMLKTILIICTNSKIHCVYMYMHTIHIFPSYTVLSLSPILLG